MSRELKRVALDFDHTGPWPGYLRTCDNEDCGGCPDCERQEPPAGDGYQIWESVSEGSPISPVFADREGCVAWLMEHEDCGRPAAEEFLDDGYAPSMIGVSAFGIFKGVQVAAGVGAHIQYLHEKAGDTSTIAPETPIRHAQSGISGKILHRFPPPNGDYYFVEWSRGLPPLLAEDLSQDPDAPMTAGCRRDGFEVVEPVGAATDG